MLTVKPSRYTSALERHRDTHLLPSMRRDRQGRGRFPEVHEFVLRSPYQPCCTYWCRALELDGVGEKLVDQLLDSGLIASCADLYRLSMDDLLGLERMGEKSATNVLREVDKARTMTLGRFLHALGLPGIGPELATSMARVLSDAEGMLDWLNDAHALPGDEAFGPQEDAAGKHYAHNQALRRVLDIEGVGEIVALQFRDGLAQRRNLVDDLVGQLTIEVEPVQRSGGQFDGMTFCVTGTLSLPEKRHSTTNIGCRW